MSTTATTTIDNTEQPRDLKVLQSGRIVAGCKNTPELLAQHLAVTKGRPYFRFPPEPNGFLHIGHAKSMNLNFGSAAAHGGCCYLRYDDTNPTTEEMVYIHSIQEMAKWMGWTPDWITFTSDHFQELYDFAVQLIHKGKAYVDHSTADLLKEQRENRTDSPWRDRPIEENLKLFDEMKQGRFTEGAATLRLKMDMKSNNPNLRDVVAYRVVFCAHPHVGDTWCVYPTYDYSHCIVDALENIDYSLCTLEFETRRESYFWLLEELNLWRPYVWEFSRLNVTGTLLSKRKINVLVKNGIVRGFDDPRLLTLAGLRRRGYTPQAINKFCDLVGVTRTLNVIQMSMLENCLREDLDVRDDRKMIIVDPLKVIIDNWVGVQELDLPNHPYQPERGTRKVKFTPEFYIDRSDFRDDGSNKKFYGIAPGNAAVGIKYSGNVTLTRMDRDPTTGAVLALHCDIDFDRKLKPKTNISWVSAEFAVPIEFRLYSYLLRDDRAALDTEFLQFIDEHSEKVVHGFGEPSLSSVGTLQSVQGERFGYFVVDLDSTPSKMVMNRVISLREDKDK